LSIGALVDKDRAVAPRIQHRGNNIGLDRLELADQLNLLFDVTGENCLNEQASRGRVIRPHHRREETRKDRAKARYR
jgi:hypothetical protein